jgi:hypothetical protein
VIVPKFSHSRYKGNVCIRPVIKLSKLSPVSAPHKVGSCTCCRERVGTCIIATPHELHPTGTPLPHVNSSELRIPSNHAAITQAAKYFGNNRFVKPHTRTEAHHARRT